MHTLHDETGGSVSKKMLPEHTEWKTNAREVQQLGRFRQAGHGIKRS
jgi:hypothetical protein